MTSGLGIVGWIGLAPESSGGVAVDTPTLIFPAMNEDMTLAINRFETTNMHGRMAQPDDQPGTREVSGGFTAAGDPRLTGFLLGAMLRTADIQVVASGTLYSHLFRCSSLGHWDDHNALPPFTLQVDRNVGGRFRYHGMVCNELAIAIAPNAPLTLGAKWVGQGFDVRTTALTASYAPPSFFRFDQASLQIDGIGAAHVEQLQIGIRAPSEAVYTLRASPYARKVKRDDFQSVRVQLSVGFEDLSDLERFRLQSNVGLRVSFAGGSFSLVLDLPSLRYTSFPTGMQRNRQTVQVDARANFHAGSGTVMDATLVSPVGHYLVPPPDFSLLAA